MHRLALFLDSASDIIAHPAYWAEVPVDFAELNFGD
jgi:hypothetical protein